MTRDAAFEERQIVKLKPSHEFEVVENGHQISDEGVQMRLELQIKNPQEPLETYWEVTYVSDTPNHDIGDTRVLSESTLEEYKIEKNETQDDIIEVSNNPQTMWDEIKQQRTTNRQKSPNARARRWTNGRGR